MFCPQFRPRIGGAERQAERLAHALGDAGFRVEVWTPLIDEGVPPFEDLGKVEVHRFRLHDLSRNHAWPGLGLLNGPYLILQVFKALWVPLARVDLLHCHIGCLLSVAAALVARLRGRPTLCKAATGGKESDLGVMRLSGAASRLMVPIARRVFDRWIATTRQVGEELRAAGVQGSRIDSLPNGVDVPEPGPEKEMDGARRILYLGRLSRNANRDIQGLLQAFEVLANEKESVELALVGGGDLLEETQALARRSVFANLIQVPGVGDSEQWLGWADCFVLPSRDEGLSNALLEAMAAGLPCIAYDIPPNREVLEDCGILVPLGDVEALAEALRSLTRDAGLARRLGSLARERVKERYSLGNIAAAYEDLYAQLLSGAVMP